MSFVYAIDYLYMDCYCFYVQKCCVCVISFCFVRLFIYSFLHLEFVLRKKYCASCSQTTFAEIPFTYSTSPPPSVIRMHHQNTQIFNVNQRRKSGSASATPAFFFMFMCLCYFTCFGFVNPSTNGCQYIMRFIHLIQTNALHTNYTGMAYYQVSAISSCINMYGIWNKHYQIAVRHYLANEYHLGKIS